MVALLLPQGLWNRRILNTLGLVVALIVLSNVYSSYQYRRSLPDIALAEVHLHLLLAAPSSSIHLCKFLMTASILGYPTPTIINWGKDYSKESGRHLEKLRGVITYLDGLKYENRRDLVIVVDAWDTWFQLRPATLIERYHTINRKATERIMEKPGMAHAARVHDIKHSVVFAADKTCQADFQSPYCYLQPEPDTPPDMYRGATDIMDAHGTVSKYRPRYINEGFIMGEAADVRAVLARAFERVDASRTDTEQSPLSAVFAEQELVREMLRQEHLGDIDLDDIPEKVRGKFGGAPKPLSEYERRLQAMAKSPDEKLFHMHDATSRGEVHITLDYGSLLSHSTDQSIRDGRYMVYSTSPPTRVYDDLGDIPGDCDSRVPSKLPNDISNSRQPISDAINVPDLPYPLPSWNDLPLYTDVCTGNVPATIHHNGDKSQIEIQWPRLWLQPHSKQLRIGQAQLAFLSLKASGPSINDGGAFTDSGHKIEWSDLCENQLWGDELYTGKAFSSAQEASGETKAD